MRHLAKTRRGDGYGPKSPSDRSDSHCYDCNILGFIPDVAAMEERQTLDPTVENVQQSAQGNVSRPPPLAASWLLALNSSY